MVVIRKKDHKTAADLTLPCYWVLYKTWPIFTVLAKNTGYYFVNCPTGGRYWCWSLKRLLGVK